MKFHKFFFLILFLAVTFQISFSQEQKAVLFDSVNQIECEDLLSRLDSFTPEIIKSSDSIAYVVIHGSSNPIDNNFYESFIKNYPRTRNFDKTRFVVLTAKSIGNFKIDFWLGKKGIKPQINEDKFGYVLSNNKTNYYFAEESFEIMKIDSKLELVGGCAACCIQNVNFGLLASFLEANSNLDAQIIIYNKTNRRQFNRFAKLISDETTKLGISRNRLKIIYGGKKEGIYVWNENMASLDVSLISNKSRKNRSQ